MKKLFLCFLAAALSLDFTLAETYEFEQSIKEQHEAEQDAEKARIKAAKEEQERYEKYQKQQAKHHNRKSKDGVILGIGAGLIPSSYKDEKIPLQTPFSVQAGYQFLAPWSNTSLFDFGLGVIYEGFYGSKKGDRKAKHRYDFVGLNFMLDLNFNRHVGGGGLGFILGGGYAFGGSSIDGIYNSDKGFHGNVGASLNLSRNMRISFTYKIPSFEIINWKTSVMGLHFQIFFTN